MKWKAIYFLLYSKRKSVLNRIWFRIMSYIVFRIESCTRTAGRMQLSIYFCCGLGWLLFFCCESDSVRIDFQYFRFESSWISVFLVRVGFELCFNPCGSSWLIWFFKIVSKIFFQIKYLYTVRYNNQLSEHIFNS